MLEEEKEERAAEAEEGGAEMAPQPEEVLKEEAKAAPEEKKVELTGEEFTELKKKAEERDEYLNMLLRAKADLQNYQKRTRKEIDALNRLAVQDLMLALLPIVDNLSRAVKSVGKDDSKALEGFLHGVELILDQFLKVLEGFGVKPIHGQEGQAFKPELHEAVMEVENDEFPHHTVLEEVEQGFFLHDRVLRPVKVKVSKKTVAVAKKGTAEGEKKGPAIKVDEGREGPPKTPSEGTQGVDTDHAVGEEEPIV
ncbi:MAG: nucleotide exchange factor GrpE [Candidatus Brocadiales bacterium]